MKKTVNKIIICCAVLITLIFSATSVLLACCCQTSDDASTINGTWLIQVVFDDNSSQQKITLSALPPFLAVRGEKNLCVLGFLMPKDNGCIVLWRCRTTQGNIIYKGSTRFDTCSVGSSDTEMVLAGTAIVLSPSDGSKVGRFTAHKQYTLRVVVVPDASGTVSSENGTIACNSDCSEQYIGGCRKVTLHAEPSEGWTFKHWQIGDTVLSENIFISLRISEDLYVVAVFEKSEA